MSETFSGPRQEFGALQRQTCPNCAGHMAVVRRTPHPDDGETFEVQTLECSECGSQEQRIVDKDGGAYI
jgi:Zn finger protein HypA/HybF involved in hydrogenase expression